MVSEREYMIFLQIEWSKEMTNKYFSTISRCEHWGMKASSRKLDEIVNIERGDPKITLGIVYTQGIEVPIITCLCLV